MRLAATGHRPDKLGGYSDHILEALVDCATAYLERLPTRPARVISGMAQGWDTAVATAALNLRIPLVAAIPFEGQELKWPEAAQRRYRDIRSRAAYPVVVSPGGYVPWKLQLRNEWMVDNCDRIVALYDGSAGGTRNCLRYAAKKGVPVDNLWSLWGNVAPRRVAGILK